MSRDKLEDPRHAGPRPPQPPQSQEGMGRAAQPAELAPAFVFLASDEARYVTGEVLGVTGGELLA